MLKFFGRNGNAEGRERVVLRRAVSPRLRFVEWRECNAPFTPFLYTLEHLSTVGKASDTRLMIVRLYLLQPLKLELSSAGQSRVLIKLRSRVQVPTFQPNKCQIGAIGRRSFLKRRVLWVQVPHLAPELPDGAT